MYQIIRIQTLPAQHLGEALSNEMGAQQQPSVMRSLAAPKYGQPEVYEILDLPVPRIEEPDQLLIKVYASSINPVDMHVATGKMKNFVPSPYVGPPLLYQSNPSCFVEFHSRSDTMFPESL